MNKLLSRMDKPIEIESIASRFNYLLGQLFHDVNQNPLWKFPKTYRSRKHSGDNKGQWGYWHNEHFLDLLETLKKLKCKSLFDLGCGSGLLLKSLQITLDIKVGGVEIEESYVKWANDRLYLMDVFHKDILKLTKKDVMNYDILYFWEPMFEEELCKKFVQKLEQILSPNQRIVYYCSGPTITYLKTSQKLIQVELEDSFSSGYRVFKLK